MLGALRYTGEYVRGDVLNPMCKRKRQVVEVAPDDYEPTQAELEEDVRLDPGDLSMDEAVETLLQPVELRDAPPTKRRKLRRKS